MDGVEVVGAVRAGALGDVGDDGGGGVRGLEDFLVVGYGANGANGKREGGVLAIR